MKPITEDYVSFETAKLLKEKGFDESVNRFYEISTGKPSLVRSEYCRNSFTIDYAAPTHQMALKWLREVHRIEIHIVLSELNADNSKKYMFDIYSSDINRGFDSVQKEEFNSYEEAVEAALKYTLENLI